MILRTARCGQASLGLRYRSAAKNKTITNKKSYESNRKGTETTSSVYSRLDSFWQKQPENLNQTSTKDSNGNDPIRDTNELEETNDHNIKSDKTAASETLRLIKENQARKRATMNEFLDLENRSLNLNLPNQKLVNLITEQLSYRMANRFTKLSAEWLKTCDRLVDELPLLKSETALMQSGETSNVNFLKQAFEYYFKRANISSRKIGEPISVGDLVIISEGGTDFFMIAACPEDIDSVHFTFINSKGKIIFGAQQLIKFRIPNILPKKYESLIKSMVMLEQKTLNVPPIGIPDRNNSRSKLSLPPELRPSSAQEEMKDSKIEMSGVESEESTLQILGEESDEASDDDFIATQAASRLLTNSDVNTYIVPESAREVYSGLLTKLSIQSTDSYKEISTRLELLHRILQFDDNGDIYDSPRHMSIFQILHFVKTLFIKKSFKEFNHADLKKFNYLVNRQYGDISQLTKTSNLGKLITDTSNNPISMDKTESQNYDLSLYFAVLLLLRKQTRLWKINQQNLANPVTSVIVLPISNKANKDEVIKRLKKNDHDVVQYIVSKIKQITDPGEEIHHALNEPKYYDEVITLFKDYIIDNLHNDFEAETLVTTLIRKIDNFLKLPNDLYSYEYGKSKCYDILQLLQEFQMREYENPVNWSLGLEINTPKTRLNDEYYKFLEENGKHHIEALSTDETFPVTPKLKDTFSFEEKFDNFEPVEIDDFYKTDPMKSFRQDYTDPIFCIDSEDAHEIDDGISLRSKPGDDSKYQVTIHIANPSSYIKPRSSISQIALNKGVTIYLPEGPIKMLPDFISELSGLGNSRPKDKPIKTFAIEFFLDKDFESKPLPEILSQISSTSSIKFYNTYNYPTGYYYNYVNKVLDQSTEQEEGDLYRKQIKTLYKVSQKLKQIRTELGGGYDFDFANSSVNVEYLTDRNTSKTVASNEFNIKEDGTYELIMNSLKIEMTSSTSASKSHLLVSEMMIISNYLTSLICKKQGIPIIYRNQVMNLPRKVVNQINDITKNLKPGEEYKDMIKIIRVMNSAKMDIYNKGHESLGLQHYSQITSPLRRYSDLINQWQIQDHMKGSKTSIDIANIANHLQAKDLINKRYSRFSNGFWQGIMIREYFRLIKHIPKEQLIPFKIYVDRAVDKYKYLIKVHKFDFRSQLELDPFDDKERQSGITKDQIFDTSDKIELHKIDFIENELSFKFVNRSNQL